MEVWTNHQRHSPSERPCPGSGEFFFVVSAAPADPGAVRVGFVGDPNVEGILGDAILAGGQPRHALTSSLGTPIFMDGFCEHTSKRLGYLIWVFLFSMEKPPFF